MQLQFQELQQYKIKNSPNRKSPGPCDLSDFFVHNKPNINSYNAREH